MWAAYKSLEKHIKKARNDTMREPSSQIPNFSSIVKVQPSQFLFILQLKDEKCETAIFFSLLLACKKATTRAVHVCACVCLCVFVFVVWTILSLCVFALHAGTPVICLLWLWPGCCFSPGSCFGDKDSRGIEITQRPRHTTPPNLQRANTVIASFQP